MRICPSCASNNPEDSRFCAQCGASLDEVDDPLLGRVVGGAYLLQEVIGAGGMGCVYRAEQKTLGRTVAVKVIHSHLLSNETVVARFYTEARASSRLNHPASVSVIDFGRAEDGTLFLVMEYLEGRDLGRVLADEPLQPLLRVCRIVRHVLSAVGEAHALGIVHRDLKPENIIISNARRGKELIKVVDFGLAHIVGPGEAAITSTGIVCGTPAYMSPEQGLGEPVDGRGDLYAAGVALFEMLTGAIPYSDDSPTKIVLKHIRDPTPDPRQVAPERRLPEALAQVCLKAMQKRREDRYQTADEMIDALVAVEKDLTTSESQDTAARCPACGTENHHSVRFCGECGGQISGHRREQARTKTDAERRVSLVIESPLAPLIGRAREVAQLEKMSRPGKSASWVRIIGEVGVGKSRLASHLTERLLGQGDVVVVGGAHPSGEPVPYWAIRELVAGLLQTDPARLVDLVSSTEVTDSLARTGLAELINPSGLEGRPGRSRSGAVAVALLWAARLAREHNKARRVVLVVDDLCRCDQLTRDVLESTFRWGTEEPLFLLTCSSEDSDGEPPPGCETLRLEGLGAADAERFLSQTEQSTLLAEMTPPKAGASAGDAARRYLPLYLEQFYVLGIEPAELASEGRVPTGLADAILMRLESLDMPARRLLQTVAVLGDGVSIGRTLQMGGEDELARLERLTKEGLLSVEVAVDGETQISFVHWFIRDLVEASIPAEHRRRLHTAALHSGGRPQVEIRALHAYRSGETLSALLLLEQMGNGALARGDASAAVLAFRRGLEVARRELLMTGDTSLGAAEVAFSYRLGDALDQAGKHTEADGVVREAVEQAGPSSRYRCKILLLLARIAAHRERVKEAIRLLGQVMQESSDKKDRAAEGDAHLLLGQLQLDLGEPASAAETLRGALDSLSKARGQTVHQVEAGLSRANALQQVGDEAAAVQQLLSCESMADELGLPALKAEVAAAFGNLHDVRQPSTAAVYFTEAVRMAEEAGDARGAIEWRRKGLASERRRGS